MNFPSLSVKNKFIEMTHLTNIFKLRKKIKSLTIGGFKWGARDAPFLNSRLNYFISMQFSTKSLPHNRFLPQTQGNRLGNPGSATVYSYISTINSLNILF